MYNYEENSRKIHCVLQPGIAPDSESPLVTYYKKLKLRSDRYHDNFINKSKKRNCRMGKR